MIKIEVQSTQAVIRSQQTLTAGLRGAKVHFIFGQDWDGLIKTAVFRQGDKTVAVADIGTEVTVPWEVLTQPGLPVQIGVYGTNVNQVAIPTLWAVTQPVRPGTDPEADPSTEPTPGLWEQMQGKLGELEQTIEELPPPVYLVTVWKNDDGSYYTEGDPDERAAAYRSGKLLMCYWIEHSLLLPVSDPDGGREFVFRTVKDQKEYRVRMTSNDLVECSCTPLVSSVNGQTGKVVVPTAVKVTITQQSDGSYIADRYCGELLEAHNAGHTVYCQYGNRVLALMVVSKPFCAFGCVQAGNVYNATITESAVTLTIKQMETGGGSGSGSDGITPHIGENGNWFIGDTDTGVRAEGKDGKDAPQEAILYTPQTLTPDRQAQARENIGAVEAPETAEVGQTIRVKSVDENGKPTAWEAADLPTEGKWELIASGAMEEDARGIEVTLDNDGNPFELTKAALHVMNIHRGTEMTKDVSCHVYIGSACWAAGVVSASPAQSTTNKEFVAYANTNGSAWLATRAYTNHGQGHMLYPFSDFIGKTITYVDFMASSAHLKLAAGLTYELWGVRK